MQCIMKILLGLCFIATSAILASATPASASEERVSCTSVNRFRGDGQWSVSIEDDWRTGTHLSAHIDQDFPHSDRFVTADEVVRHRDGEQVTYTAKTKNFVITVEAPNSTWLPRWLDRSYRPDLTGRLEGELDGMRVSEELRCSGFFDRSLD